MANQEQQKPAPNAETDIWNAISAFEKILEALPNDRISLEALADAYEQVGDHTRAKEYYLRLANVLIDESDEDAARDLLRKIRGFDTTDPEVARTIARIEQLEPEKVMADVIDDEGPARRTSNIADELTLAWNLLQANKLTQEEYANVVHDLSENLTKVSNAPVSVLHVLNDRGFKGINDVMAFLATTCGTPVLALRNFEFHPAVAGMVPEDFIVRRKALVFEIMGRDALVAILNPYDTQTKSDIQDLCGRPCHFYLVNPTDFDEALDKIRKALAEEAKEQAQRAKPAAQTRQPKTTTPKGRTQP